MAVLEIIAMERTIRSLEAASIVAVIVVVSYIHYAAPHGDIALHLMHREMYFIPILLAALWFGLKGGILSAMVVGMVYAPHIGAAGNAHGQMSTVVSQLAMFGIVGVLVGIVVDRKSKHQQKAELVTDTFGRYVPVALREQLLKGTIPLDGAMVQVAVLIAGIKEFERIIEELPPWHVAKIVNTYFSRMSEIVRRNGGIVLRTVDGDLHTVFGAPLADQDRNQKALDTAVSMRHALQSVNDKLYAFGLPNIGQSIGVHSGMAMAANIGSPERLTYTVIGRTVSGVAMIKRKCDIVGADILVSGSVLQDGGLTNALVQVNQEIDIYGESIELYELREKQ